MDKKTNANFLIILIQFLQKSNNTYININKNLRKKIKSILQKLAKDKNNKKNKLWIINL